MQQWNEAFLAISEYFSILSDPSRLKIIHFIHQQPYSVNEIVAGVNLAQANVSRHLSYLYKARVVSRRKERNIVYYHVSDSTLINICNIVCNRIAEETEDRVVLKQQLSNLLAYKIKPEMIVS